MKLLKINQSGRSMIEMLGVLAIVGILSVGGISGFSKAMFKHKLNKAIEQYNLVFDLIATDNQKWKRISTASANYYHLSGLWKKMDVLPKSMIKHPTNEELYDAFSNRFYVRKFPKYIEWGIMMNSGNDGVFSTNMGSKNICQELMLNALAPRHENIKYLFLYLGGGSEGSGKYYFYGDNFCGESKKCIRDMTISDITQICEDCEDDKLCRIAAIFPL